MLKGLRLLVLTIGTLLALPTATYAKEQLTEDVQKVEETTVQSKGLLESLVAPLVKNDKNVNQVTESEVPFVVENIDEQTSELVNEMETAIESIELPSVKEENSSDDEIILDEEADNLSVDELEGVEGNRLNDETEAVLQEENKPDETIDEVLLEEQPTEEQTTAVENGEEALLETVEEELPILLEADEQEEVIVEETTKEKLPILSSIGTGLGKLFGDLGTNTGTLLQEAVTNIGQTVVHVVENTVQTVVHLVENVVNVVVEPVKAVVEVTREAITAKANATLTNTPPPSAKDITEDLLRGVVGGLLGSVEHLVVETVNDVGNLTTDLVNDVVYLVADTVTDTTKLTVDLVKDTVQTVTGVAETITEQIKEATDPTVPVIKPENPVITNPPSNSNDSSNTYPSEDSSTPPSSGIDNSQKPVYVEQPMNKDEDSATHHHDMKPIMPKIEKEAEKIATTIVVEEPIVALPVKVSIENQEVALPAKASTENQEVALPAKASIENQEMLTEVIEQPTYIVPLDREKYSVSYENANEPTEPVAVTNYRSNTPNGETNQTANGHNGNSNTIFGIVNSSYLSNILYEGSLIVTQVVYLKGQWIEEPLGQPPQKLLFYAV
ncbi:hypothetical protein [Massilibacterium senegalense]|uniref:hypothetical protein n=1 Tax=Massilibacterium senegalense TaxID=1632858 RepID=UPI000782FBC4|nr:hypothetical protein [Massilibacterium senegalense]